VTEHLTLEHLRLQHAGSQGGRNLGNGSRPAAKSTVRSIMNFFRKRNPQVLLVSQDWIRCHRAGATFGRIQGRRCVRVWVSVCEAGATARVWTTEQKCLNTVPRPHRVKDRSRGAL
jgi:hypothetical protein